MSRYTQKYENIADFRKFRKFATEGDRMIYQFGQKLAKIFPKHIQRQIVSQFDSNISGGIDQLVESNDFLSELLLLDGRIPLKPKFFGQIGYYPIEKMSSGRHGDIFEAYIYLLYVEWGWERVEKWFFRRVKRLITQKIN